MQNLIFKASNLRGGINSPYSLADFYLNYPAFAPKEIPPEPPETVPTFKYLIDPAIIKMYLDLANACLQESRWRSYWKIAMGWFIAHFLTVHLQSMAEAGSCAHEVIAAGRARGLEVSKSAGDISVSYDYSAIANDLDGWANWKSTIYGRQLATVGKIVGKGGMYVW